MRNISRAASRLTGCATGCALLVSLAPFAQAQFGRGGGTWNTAGADAQRTSWARTDARISAASMPGFSFLWKVKANNDAKQSYALSSAVMVDSYIGYRGFRSYAFLGGASNNAVALDTDLGRVEWQQNLGPVASSGTCGAMTGGVTRPTTLPQPAGASGAAGGRGAAAAGGRGAGRGAASGVSEPEAGAITIGQGRGGGGGGGAAGASGGRGGGGAGGGRGGALAASGAGGRGPGGPGGGRPPEAVYAVATDGTLRTLFISNGANAKPPVAFLPANASASGILLVANVVYASTSGNCPGVPNGVWAIDTSAATPTPIHWSSNGGGIAGIYGIALATDGDTAYAATSDGDYSPAAFSDSVVALDTKTLKLKDWFTPGKSDFTTSPVVFSFGGKDVIAAANKDGKLYLLDSTALGGADHKTPLSSVAFASSGALATWEDASGSRWLLAPGNSSVAAFKVIEQNGKPTLQSGWTSGNIASPLPPIVINGFVFTASTGAGAKLYALDGATGKELFNSGSTITGTILRSGGLSGSAGQIYIATSDSTIYAFGIPLVPPALAVKVQ